MIITAIRFSKRTQIATIFSIFLLLSKGLIVILSVFMILISFLFFWVRRSLDLENLNSCPTRTRTVINEKFQSLRN